MQNKIILDLDSTLCSFVEPWLEWLVREKYTNHYFKMQDVTHYSWLHENFGQCVTDFFLQDPIGLYMDVITPYPQADNFVNWCVNNFEIVEIVTHSSTKETEIAKTAFIEKHFNLTHRDIRFFSVLEEKVNHVSGSILVDDYPLHIIKHIAQNKMPGIVFDWQRSNGWSKLANYIAMLEEEKPNLGLYNSAGNYCNVIDILNSLKGPT